MIIIQFTTHILHQLLVFLVIDDISQILTNYLIIAMMLTQKYLGPISIIVTPYEYHKILQTILAHFSSNKSQQSC